MVNITDFIKRLEVILDYYGLNASSFADKIGVQRSSMSHLLSGRNKPSLDFILKITEVFPEVDLYWILNGKGHFPAQNEQPIENSATTSKESLVIVTDLPKINPSDLFTTAPLLEESFIEKPAAVPKPAEPYIHKPTDTSKDIDRIVVFYQNGTFKTYSSENQNGI